MLCGLIINVEFEEEVLEFTVMDGVFRIHPFTKHDVTILQSFVKRGPPHLTPLFKQVVLRVHSLGDQMAATLQCKLLGIGKMSSYVGAINLLLHDERFVLDQGKGFPLRMMLVIFGSFRPE